jgi:cell division septation protein DedD
MEAREEHEHIVFEEHDLLHADHAVPLNAPVAAAQATGEAAQHEIPAPAPPAAPPDNGDRPLLFESRTTWTGQSTPEGRRRWRRRTKRLAIVAAVLALIVAASFGQAQWEDSVEVMTAPEPPASPLATFALKFQPKRAADRVPLTPDAAADAAIVPPAPAAAEPAPAGIFAIDVALFNSTTRASRLATDLVAANHHAYVRDLDLGDRGHLFEVMVGPFASREEAGSELARIHALPGYEDARLVSSTP